MGLVPSNYQLVLEFFFFLTMSVLKENLHIKNRSKFFPLISTLFFFILSTNLLGLIPYSYTLTSQLVITVTLSMSIFIGINLIAIQTNGIKIFSLFLPSGTSIQLSFLLIPIEIISYMFKPVSLAVRLFANLMAGHTLLKVIAGFGVSLTLSGGFFTILSFFPILILIPLFVLEFSVCLIQSYVFVVLITIYIQDGLCVSH